ncbi:MAG: DUF2683 family protein [DPANN group archaeon]|nr:DUF2683 family protein [DPANN group archaeon]
MSQVTVTLERNADKVVGIIKSAYGFSSKDKAIQFIIMETGEEIIERELRPEFVKKILNLEKKGKFNKYRSVNSLRDEIETA